MNRKYGIGITSPYCFQTLEHRLRKESEKGWMMDKMGIMLARFKRCEPRKRAVQVVFDPDALEYGTDPTPYSQGLEDLIGSTGWYKTCDYFKQKIYYNDDPDAVPIETDDRLKLETIKDAMLPTSFLTVVIVFFFVLSMGLHGDLIFAIMTASGGLSRAIGPLCIALVPLYLLTAYIHYNIWLTRSEKSIEVGGGLADDKGAAVIDRVFYAAALILLILLVIEAIISADGFAEEIQAIIRSISPFVIVFVGRNLGLTVKRWFKDNHKTCRSWIVYLIVSAVIVLLYYAVEALLSWIR